jgi:hypothetical protein
MLAIPAASIHAANPGDSNASACRKIRCTGIRNLSNDLMSRNEFIAKWRQLALDNMQIRTTNSAGAHTKENLPWLELWTRYLADFKRMLRNITRRRQNSGFHLGHHDLLRRS